MMRSNHPEILPTTTGLNPFTELIDLHVTFAGSARIASVIARIASESPLLCEECGTDRFLIRDVQGSSIWMVLPDRTKARRRPMPVYIYIPPCVVERINEAARRYAQQAFTGGNL